MKQTNRVLALVLVLTLMLSMLTVLPTNAAVVTQLQNFYQFEAENYVDTDNLALPENVTVGAANASNNNGVSGQYIQYNGGNLGTGTFMEFTLDGISAGDYQVIWGLRSHSSTDCTVQVLVNDVSCGEINCKPGSESLEGTAPYTESCAGPVDVGVASFQEGTNKVRFQVVQAGTSNRLNVDYIRLEAVGREDQAIYWAYRNQVSADVAATLQYYDSSEGYFSRYDFTGIGQSATYQINDVAEAGKYNLTIRYRTHETTGSANVYVNGVQLETALVPEGNANSCNNLDLGTVDLNAGSNTINFQSTGAGSGGKYGINIFTFTITRIPDDNEIVSVGSVNSKTVSLHVPLADIALPQTLQVTLGSGATEDLPVTWTGYDAETAGDQILTGVLDLSGTDYTNPDEFQASVKVTVHDTRESGGYVYLPSEVVRTEGNTTYLAGDTTNLGGQDVDGYCHWFVKESVDGLYIGSMKVYVPYSGFYKVSYQFKTSGTACANHLQLYAPDGSALGLPINKDITSSSVAFNTANAEFTPCSYYFEAPGFYTFTWSANAVFTVSALRLTTTSELEVNAKSGSVVSNGENYDMTWNISLLDSYNDKYETFNKNYNIVDHGVIVTATAADMETYGAGLVRDRITAEEASGKAYKRSFGTTAYSNYTYRLEGVATDKTRYAMFYIIYQTVDGSTEIYTYWRQSETLGQKATL